MRKIYSFLLLGLLLSIGNAWATTSTLTFTAKCNGSGTADDGVVWTVTSDGTESNFEEDRGIHYGTSKAAVKYIQLSTSQINTGTITSVVVNASGNNNPSLSVTVGGNAFGTTKTNLTTTNTEYTFSGSAAAGEIVVLLTKTSSMNKALYVKSIAVTYTTAPVTPTCATPTFTPEAGTYTSAQNVSIACTTEGSVIHYTTDETAPTAQSAVYSSPIAVTATTTIKAIAVADGYENSAIETAEYEIVNIEHAGTQQDPYTIADARNAIDANIGITNVYAIGVVSEVIEYNETYHNITYNISADGLTTSDQLQAYRGKSYNGDNFTSEDDIQVGDEVVVYGSLTKYNSTYEFTQNNQLVSLNRPGAAPVINAENVELAYNATSGEITYTISNATEATLTAASSTLWISNINVTADKVTFTTTANEGDIDRVGYITLSYTGADDKLITVTQAHYVIDYAVLPFEWAGGVSADLLNIVGVTASGLGSDYGDVNAPYLVKLDGTGDYIQIKTDSQPAKVTIGVKKIGGAGVSSISVQESSDGTNFSEVQLFAINGDQNATLTLATTTAFAASTRYIKMVFTKASNVGVGPITITKVTNDPSVVVEETSINVPYTGALDGVINVTYNNITEIEAEVAFFEEDGTTPLAQEPDWIITDIDNQTHNLVYVVDVNEGAARTAYMKVVALDDEANVYSELITVTQSACVYAVLPFFFNDGRADIENTPGLTQDGLDSDYGSSPKLKFNTTGDYLVLRLNENAGVLSFDIKGNSFEGGTFSVQVSTDGSNYSNLDEFTALATTANMAYSLAAGVRYIKWIYTEKSAGNVALGNIKVRKPADASITLGTNGWSTYAIDYTCKLSGAEVYKAAYNEQQNAVVLTEVENAVVPAGEGIILKGTEGASVTITPSAKAASNFEDNDLVGVLAPTEAEANWYVLATNIDGDGLTKFHNCQAGIEIPANKAFIEIGEATAPSIRIIEAGNEATDIQNVEGAEKAVKFIENGKLYIQKNGVVYDAMGKTVR